MAIDQVNDIDEVGPEVRSWWTFAWSNEIRLVKGPGPPELVDQIESLEALRTRWHFQWSHHQHKGFKIPCTKLRSAPNR